MAARGVPGLSDEQVQRVRAALEELLAREVAAGGERGALSRVAARIGLSAPAMSQLRPRGPTPPKNAPSLPTATAIARELGMAPEQLLYDRAPTGTRHRDLVGWATAEARALASPEEVVPHRAVRAAGDLPVMFQPQPLDAGYVVALATLWQDYSADAASGDVADARAKMAAEDAPPRLARAPRARRK